MDSTAQPAPISVRSLTRRVDLSTPLDPDNETAWLLLLVPEGSTDEQVLEWAAETLPPEAVEELRAVIESEAS
jgi:hypothetical protein